MRFNWKLFGKIILPIALVLNVYAVWNSYQKDGPWKPLGTFPVPQIVADRSVTVVDKINVTGIKCSNLKVPLMAAGAVQWQRPDKKGVIFPAGGGVGIRHPGCKTLQFENTIPLVVQNYVNAEKEPVLFFISGVETPLKTSCDLTREIQDISECETTGSGEPKHWFTESFTISPVGQ